MCRELSHSICFIIPSHIHEHIARNGNERQKELAFRALTLSSRLRGQLTARHSSTSQAALLRGSGLFRLECAALAGTLTNN